MNRIKIVLVTFIVWLLATTFSAAQTWSQLQTVGTAPAGIEGVGYDATNNILIAFVPSTSGSQVWVLTNANGLGGTATWTQLTATGAAPTPHTEASVVYDNLTNQLIVYGGCQSSCGAPLSDVTVLSNANGLGGTPVWSQNASTQAEPRDAHSAVYNSSNKRMIAFGGGLAFFGTDQNDSRVLSPANGAVSSWTTLAPAGGPPGVREGHTAVYDQTHNRMAIFGGNNSISTCCPYDIQQYNDVWVLTDADGRIGTSPAWVQLAPTGTAPSPRASHSAAYDPSKNMMYIFGGLQWSNATQSSTPLGDLWRLSNASGRAAATPKWTQIGQLGTPPGALYSHSAAFDSANQRMIVVGGGDRNFQGVNLTFILDLLQH